MQFKKKLDSAEKSLEAAKKEKKKIEVQLKQQIATNQKLKTGNDALNDELSRIKSLNI